MPDKIQGLLGLAQKAGKIASGEAAALESIQKGKVSLVLIAEDASERTQNEFTGLCRKNNVKYILAGEKLKYGLMLGKSPRSVVAVTDHNFAKSIAQHIE